MAEKLSNTNLATDIEQSCEISPEHEAHEDGKKLKQNQFKSSLSENSIKTTSLNGTGKGFKQKLVSRVRSWSAREKFSPNKNTPVLASSQNVDVECPLVQLESVRVRGSLENFTLDRRNIFDNPTNVRSYSLSDHLDKKTRRNVKNILKRKKKYSPNQQSSKKEESPLPKAETSHASEEARESEAVDDEFAYKYNGFTKNNKSVGFKNEVFVVFFKGDDVIGESKEALKKDTEQQLRNKEMRQGHLMKTQEKYNLCLY